ncbi:MAG: acyltransferase family protein, partial [Spirochaetia bacterium]|nr:acyltransferase family protein [Spirochaetia bacterium]
METQKRNHFVDVLKGICIIFVIFTHASWTNEQRVKLLFPFWIYMAVPFFMLVSGYVYTKSFQKNGIETLDSAYNKKYLLINLIRYTIPYFIAFMIDFCVQVFLYIRNPTGMKRFFVHEIALFLQGGNGPGSYYYPEMIQIMFLFPIIYVLVRKYNWKGVLVVALATFFFEVLKFPYMVNEGQYRLLLFRYFMLIAFGS